jgi:hypothetical protein
MNRREFLPWTVAPLLPPFMQTAAWAAEPMRFDVVVYGGTAGGIMAAISVARAGGTAVVLEPTQHIGGMVTGGLGRTDIGVSASIGGIALEFYRRLHAHYADPAAWTFQTREEYRRPKAAEPPGSQPWWLHEPSAAAAVLRGMIDEAKIDVLTGHVLAGVDKDGARIRSIRCANGATFVGGVFIDATYEGDLLALAGVSYRVGREAAAEYGEKFAGVVPRRFSSRKQWTVDVSPFDANGKLLFGVQDTPRGEDHAGDRKVQAYNYRICLTDAEANRLPIEKPANYDVGHYELLARFIAGKPDLTFSPRGLLNIGRLPNRKTDINDGGPFSTDFIGANWDYPDGDAATRRRIIQEHTDYTQGLLYFIGHDERVPELIRNEMLRYGYPKDEYTATGHWSPQLYIREARRMVGTYVMTSHDIDTNRAKDDSVGMASYLADSHHVQRINDGGVVRNEGNPNDFTGQHQAYEVPYRALLPHRHECDNLLVTFCVSASHMAFASLRMEPVFMILSESAGLAALAAIRERVAVQDVSYATLHPTLTERHQLLRMAELPVDRKGS